MESEYRRLCQTYSDIWEHLPTLERYARDCEHITECGVRTAVSSYALGYACLGRPSTRLVQIDPWVCEESRRFQEIAKKENIDTVFHQMSDLECPIEETDLLFIDTWHIYGQMKRELDRWNTHVRKYIIMHDTEVDRWMGETMRCGLNAEAQSRESGIPVSEIMRGIWPAVLEFLETHPEWVVHEHYTNCNGLTVLKRK